MVLLSNEKIAALLLLLVGADFRAASGFNTLLTVPVHALSTSSTPQPTQPPLPHRTFDRKTVVVHVEPSSKDSAPFFADKIEEASSSNSDILVDTAQFGEVVSMPKKKKISPNSEAQFGEVVSLRPKTTRTVGEDIMLSSTDDSVVSSSSSSPPMEETVEFDAVEVARSLRQKNIITAVTSVVVAISSYLYQLLNPVTELQLLVAMQQSSKPIQVIGTNNKPTVIDFWAPWCENCKLSAATMSYIEKEYGENQVNFISVNADTEEAYDLISAFGVDAIPHVAMIDANGYVETALIGPIPKRVFEADINTMIQNAKECPGAAGAVTTAKTTLPSEAAADVTPAATDTKMCPNKQELPYTMYDAFEFRPGQRIVKFD